MKRIWNFWFGGPIQFISTTLALVLVMLIVTWASQDWKGPAPAAPATPPVEWKWLGAPLHEPSTMAFPAPGSYDDEFQRDDNPDRCTPQCYIMCGRSQDGCTR